MNRRGGKNKQKTVTASSVFSPQEIAVFQQVFDRLSNNSKEMLLGDYVSYVKEFTQNSQNSIMKLIVEDLETEADLVVDFKTFQEILENKVGDIKTTTGLQKIFGFITLQNSREKANLSDLSRVRDELGLTVSDKDLQKLVNFITSSYNQTDAFTFEQFEDYVFKTHPRTK